MLTDDGRPVCGSCAATPKRRLTQAAVGDPRADVFGARPLTVAEWETTARAAGWAVGELPGIGHDALCPRCRRPDPVTVRLCRELQDSIGEGP